MKPYIEYKGKTYEFEADFLLDKDFKREVKKEQEKALTKALANRIEEKGMTEEEANKLQESANIVQEYAKEHSEIKNVSEMPIEILEKLGEISFLLEDFDLMPIYREYCYKMLNKKYGVTRVMWQDMLEEYYNDYCEDEDDLEKFFNRIIELVFTNTASQKLERTKKKPKMDWLN